MSVFVLFREVSKAPLFPPGKESLYQVGIKCDNGNTPPVFPPLAMRSGRACFSIGVNTLSLQLIAGHDSMPL